jgi:hypothetical protein
MARCAERDRPAAVQRTRARLVPVAPACSKKRSVGRGSAEPCLVAWEGGGRCGASLSLSKGCGVAFGCAPELPTRHRSPPRGYEIVANVAFLRAARPKAAPKPAQGKRVERARPWVPLPAVPGLRGLHKSGVQIKLQPHRSSPRHASPLPATRAAILTRNHGRAKTCQEE